MAAGRSPLTRTLVLVRAPERHASPAVQAVEEEIAILTSALAERMRWRALTPAAARPYKKGMIARPLRSLTGPRALL
ncbi:MAG: hypothetical protein NVV62_09110 [Terricaulis sp.]|nr:hypothetical protein [Terricaulis sp.]